MSITSAVASRGTNKFIVPCAGKMFRSNISNDDKALCFVLNKGYFETNDLVSMLSILEDASLIKGFVLVGKIEKVRLVRTGIIVYRQRLFFKSLNTLLKFCKSLGLRFELSRDFHITINNVLNCVDDLLYLERYAKRYDESIDTWLTHCCIIELYYYMKSMNMYSSLEAKVKQFLNNRNNYLERAPFLISSYNIETKSSGIFLGFDPDDSRLFKERVTGIDLLKEGYTEKNVEEDIKGGRFR